MTVCLSCGAGNTPAQKFCGECGQRLELVCPACSTVSAPGKKFCGECGTPFSGGTTERKAVAPSAYTPKHLAERILTSKTSLEGERKQVTVLFADLKGSMEMLADLDPEEAREVIDPVIEKMMEEVHRYEGTVNQIMGDGIMALFGAPISHEDHALRACYAALAMQSSIQKYNEATRRSQGVEIRIRVGMNSGEVVVRTIGNDLLMEYSAIGKTTHLAARMEQLAAPGSIRLTAFTLHLVEGFVRVNALGPVPVKGLENPIEVFELTGASSLRNRVQAAAARGLTRFVGRVTELESMTDALQRAATGRGQVVALVGEPGVGKSRLIWEFSHSHRMKGWMVIESASVSYGKAPAFKPLQDMLKVYFQIEDQDTERRVREKVSGKLLTLDRSLEPFLPAFYTLLDVFLERPDWQALPPQQKRLQILEACRRLLIREAQVQPLLVVFEDLHWIDAETQAFLDGLVETLPTAPILLAVNYRPEYKQTWSSKSYYRQLHIDPLTQESADELLTGLLGDGPDLLPLRRMLAERTHGNPFFIEESVKTLAETQVLAGERGRYRLVLPITEVQVPGRVQAVIAARIDRLPIDDKRLLQVASVLGKDVPLGLLEAISDLSEDTLQQALTRLQAAEFIYEKSLFPELEYTFKHALTHEVAYGGMLQERRRTVHGRIVDAMEKLYAGRLLEHVERLGQHALRGQLWEKAVQYLKQAGDKALARSAIEEAVSHYDQALSALAQMPATTENLQSGIDIRLELRNALHPLAEFDRAYGILNDARELAVKLGDRNRLGRALSLLAQSYRVKGDYKQALAIGHQAIELGQALGDIAIIAPANYHVGQTCFHLADHENAFARFQHNLDLLQGELGRQRVGMAGSPSVFTRGQLALMLSERGEFSKALMVAEEAVQISIETKHGYARSFAAYCVGYVYLRKGEFKLAVSRLEQGLDMCRGANFRFEIPFASTFLGAAYARIGRLDEGIALLESAVVELARRNHHGCQSWLHGFLAEAYALAGRFDDSIRTAHSAAQFAREYGEPGWGAWACYLEGFARSRRSGEAASTEAAELFREAASQAERLHMMPLKVRSELSLARQMVRLGEQSKANALVSSAISHMRDMEMRFWDEEGEKILAQSAGGSVA